jgi:hypothetical protein
VFPLFHDTGRVRRGDCGTDLLPSVPGSNDTYYKNKPCVITSHYPYRLTSAYPQLFTSDYMYIHFKFSVFVNFFLKSYFAKKLKYIHVRQEVPTAAHVGHFQFIEQFTFDRLVD